MKQELINRLTTYAKMNTQSDFNSNSIPSTPGQLELARLLVDELNVIGMEDVEMDENGYVMATLPANTTKDIPTIGFLAHLDTATEFTGKNVKPQIIENFDGEDLLLNEKLNITLSNKDFPELSAYKEHTLMTTDGTTLLGADNKAGIAEIMTAMNFLITNPDVKHGKIRVAFTPDEEIGRGPKHFDVDKFNATYAYTIDGGPLGELQYESFNAAIATVIFNGISVHPGTAKNKLINAGNLAAEFINKFPKEETPEQTEGYEGFYHLISTQGNVDKSEVTYIIRDFDHNNFEERKRHITTFVNQMKQQYGEDSAVLKLTDQYYNMRKKIEPVMEVVNVAHQAMSNLKIDPIIEPIRGGTDGSQLSYMGLPTPNIFTGGENFHGRFEYISVDNMEKATKVIVEICKLFAAK